MIIIKTDASIFNFDNIIEIDKSDYADQSRLYAHTVEGDDVLIFIDTREKCDDVFKFITESLEKGQKIIDLKEV